MVVNIDILQTVDVYWLLDDSTLQTEFNVIISLKATVLVDVLEQHNDHNISLIISKYASVVYFHTKYLDDMHVMTLA